MKNKNIFIGIAVVAVIAIGGYFVFGKNIQVPSFTSQSTSLKALLAAGTSQKCSFTTTNGESSSSGDVFVGGGKLRGDFTSVTSGKTTKSHLVVSNNMAYLWIDEPLQGFRMSFDTMDGKSGSGSMDANANTDYKCQPWGAEETKFTLPPGVNFQDMTALMQQAGAGAKAQVQTATQGTSGSASAGAGTSAGTSGTATQSYAAQQCAACNMITDSSAKAQCKASFDCR